MRQTLWHNQCANQPGCGESPRVPSNFSHNSTTCSCSLACVGAGVGCGLGNLLYWELCMYWMGACYSRMGSMVYKSIADTICCMWIRWTGVSKGLGLIGSRLGSHGCVRVLRTDRLFLFGFGEVFLLLSLSARGWLLLLIFLLLIFLVFIFLVLMVLVFILLLLMFLVLMFLLLIFLVLIYLYKYIYIYIILYMWLYMWVSICKTYISQIVMHIDHSKQCAHRLNDCVYFMFGPRLILGRAWHT